MNNRQVAGRFAQGKTSGKGSHMMIVGNTIYSYGYHFAIAKLVTLDGKTYALFTTRSYSHSTSKHKGHVWSALLQAGIPVVYCHDPERTADENHRRACASLASLCTERSHIRTGTKKYAALSGRIIATLSDLFEYESLVKQLVNKEQNSL